MLGGLIAANSSTILTHLNWGSSYLVHDFYRRFIAPDAEERHYVTVGRLCTAALYVVAALLSFALESAQDAFEILISDRCGHGAALSAALVLVAHQRVDRSRRDDQLVCDLSRLLHHAQERPRPALREHGARSRSRSPRCAG